MTKRTSFLVAACAFIAALAFAGGIEKKRGPVQPFVPSEVTPTADETFTVTPDNEAPRASVVGVYTTLNGFYDYQSNGSTMQVRVNPANGNIHVVHMIAEDSANANTSRRTAYAFSTNNGATWNNFGNVRVPARRSGFPTIDLLQGANAGSPVIGNHNDPGSGLTSLVYVDSPEGSGAFSELNPLPALGGDEPIWPHVAGAFDGSIVVLTSRSAGGTAHYSRTADFSTWTPYALWPGGGDNGGFYAVAANGTGRVGFLMNYVVAGLELFESTNNGIVWPATATRIHDSTRIVGPDTFQVWTGSDIVYNGNTPYVVANELNVGASDPTDGSQIVFWSQATGWRVVATRANTPNVTTALNRAQSNHRTMSYPVMGLSGSNIVVVWMGFRSDTSAGGFNYGEIYASVSSNGGTTWTPAKNVTQTPTLDERYPSISRFNPSGFANIVWQEDPEPGTHAVAGPDNAFIRRSRQVFWRPTIAQLTTDVRVGNQIPEQFGLEQNYPNPFNPATKISYSVASGVHVSLKVYDALGQEVAELVNDYRRAGNYEQSFDALSLSSGVYYYTLTAGNFTSTKKMILMK
jgi:hypothetical protein